MIKNKKIGSVKNNLTNIFGKLIRESHTPLKEVNISIFDKKNWGGCYHIHSDPNQWVAVPKHGSFIFWSTKHNKYELIYKGIEEGCPIKKIPLKKYKNNDFYSMAFSSVSFNIQIKKIDVKKQTTKKKCLLPII